MLTARKHLPIFALEPAAYAHYCADVSIGDDIRAARMLLGMTQQELSARSGVSLRQISNIENGAAAPGYSTLSQIARVLGITELRLAGTKESDVISPADSSDVDRQQGERSTPTFELPNGMLIVQANPDNVMRRVEACVAAGHGGWDDAIGEEFVQLPRYLFGPDDFLVRAAGESMVDEGIEDGDYLIVERRPSGIAAHGELVIAWLNDGLVIKRWYRRNGKKFLESANEAMGWKPREITSADVFEIQAVVRQIVKSARRIS
jgi:SOS-response transcriptional repressor LexA